MLVLLLCLIVGVVFCFVVVVEFDDELFVVEVCSCCYLNDLCVESVSMVICIVSDLCDVL